MPPPPPPYCVKKKNRRNQKSRQGKRKKRDPPSSRETKVSCVNDFGANVFNLPNLSKKRYGCLSPFLTFRQFGKPQNTRTKKNLSSKSALLTPTVPTSAFHSTNLFLFSRHHILTNSVAPLSAYKPTLNPQFLQSL